MKILSIGDIHTRNWIIKKVIEISDNYDAIVFCGDYADNWGASCVDTIATWEFIRLLTTRKNSKFHALIGNHDYSYIHTGIINKSSGWNKDTYMLLNAPENVGLKKWLLSLPVVCTLDGVTFSHAGVTKEWNERTDVSSLWNETSPIWARPKEFGGYADYKDISQVFGHSPSESIWRPTDKAWCIDTFSEHRDNSPIGDYTVLEITDGKKFNILKLKGNKNEHHDDITSFKN